MTWSRGLNWACPPALTRMIRHSQLARRRPREGPLLRGKVLGIIDGGLAFAHANFLRNGRTRRPVPRQDRAGVGTVPAALGYGHELTGAEIDRVMQANVFGGLVDETAVYAHFQMGMELNKRINHGTHVLDIAAGPRTVLAQIAGAPPFPEAPPTWAMANDDASRCDILAVQLDWDTVLDTSGGSMNVHIMDGLMYMLSRCESSARLVVNLSWGTLSGPHDGSSVLEAAMDQLIGLKAGRLQIILPASNSYGAHPRQCDPVPGREPRCTGAASPMTRPRASWNCGFHKARAASRCKSRRRAGPACPHWRGANRAPGTTQMASRCAR